MSRLFATTAFALIFAAQSAAAADKKDAKWDVNKPLGGTIRQVPIAVDEGSWIDVDVSRDGRSVAFSLLGDIYTMPIAGGTPTRIAEGLAWEVQPRFSPDGARIAFTSDRGGGDNIWIMDADGSNKKQLTTEAFRLLNQPSWSPDGRFIVAKKHFTTSRSLGTGEIWLYHVSGGDGVPLVKKPNERHQKELGEPIYSADGKSVFYTRNITGGPIFEYAQNSNTDLFNIERFDLETGTVATAVSGVGGSVRPAPSPNGLSIAFVRREKTRSKLYVKNLKSGEERKVYDALDQDVQETWAVTGVYPNIAWTPDHRSIVFWAGGKIRRVDVDGQNAQVIPFRVNDTRGVMDAPRPQIIVAPDSFATRMTRFANVSPDGKSVVYESLGKLWVRPVAGGTPRMLSQNQAEVRQLHPSWSRDGRYITFTEWSDIGFGRVMVAEVTSGGARVAVGEPGLYARPRFSPDASTIVYEKGKGGDLLSSKWSENPGIYRVSISGTGITRVSREGASPHFGASNDRIFMVTSGDGKQKLISTDLNGEAARTHANGDLVNDFVVSPDGQYIAFRQNYEAFVTPMMPGMQDVSVGPKGGALPVVRASKGGADSIHWSGGGATLHWSVGANLYTAQRAQMFGNAPGGSTGFAPPANPVSLSTTVAADKPTGAVVLTGARIVTMAAGDGGIIDDGMLVIRGDRIVAIGKRGSVAVPAGAVQVDVAGKTIIPGLIDAHAHGSMGSDEIIPNRNWSMIANLALGTTTMHDPSNRASEVFAAAELQRAGQILAPRLFSTGEIVYGAKAAGVYAEISSYDDALAHIRRLKAQGAHSVKNYNQPRREQRQQVVAAARAENMQVVAEGGSLFGMDMNLVADGNSTLEHNVPLNIFYQDVVDFFAQSKTNYTPTLVVTYGGPAGDPYWRQATDVFAHPLLKAHYPPGELEAVAARRTKAPEGDYVDDDAAREAHKLAKRGVQVSIGAHGQQAGIGAHWELWSFVRGGMTPVEALSTGTISAARSLGMSKDIGSLEVGKLADLVVLDADPTSDIRNTDKIHRVMLGGRLYDPVTMNEVATGTRQRGAYWWEQ